MESHLNDNPIDESILDASLGFKSIPDSVQLLDNTPRIFKTILKDVFESTYQTYLFIQTFQIFFLIPLEFKGTIDPVEAKIWLKEMEKTFEISWCRGG